MEAEKRGRVGEEGTILIEILFQLFIFGVKIYFKILLLNKEKFIQILLVINFFCYYIYILNFLYCKAFFFCFIIFKNNILI